jgi:hypothetical protein
VALINSVPLLDAGDSINRGLRAWYPLTEAAGAVAYDISPARQVGFTTIGAATRKISPIGKSVIWAGTNGYFYDPEFYLPSGSALSASFWMGPVTTFDGAFEIGSAAKAAIWANFAGTIYWDYPESGGRISVANPNTAAVSNIVVTSSATSFRAIYHNGKLIASTNAASSPATALTGLLIGRNSSGGASMNDPFGNFRVWQRCLTPAEVMRLYREPWAGSLQGRTRRAYDVASGGPITGSAAITLGSLTSSGTGTLSITGTASRTLAALTSTGTGTLAIAGTAAPTLAALTSTGSGTLSITGSGTVTLGALASSGTATLDITGTAAATLDDLTSASVEAPTAATGGRLRRYRRQIVWDDPPPELAPVVSLAQNYADDLAVERAVDAAIAKMEAMSARVSMARRARVVEEVKTVILDAIERAAEQDDEDALIALL